MSDSTSVSPNQSSDTTKTCENCDYYDVVVRICTRTGDPENTSSGACEEFYPVESIG
jgi:hypothetical protein